MATQSQNATITIGKAQLEQLIAKVSAATAADTRGLLDAIGQQQEDSARRRIFETKRAPDGKRWKAWSRAYAETRGPQHSLLRDRGALAESLTHAVDGKEAVEVGSNMNYAGALLFGRHARPFLDVEPGFADPHDRDEIRDLVGDFLEGLL